VNFSWSAHEPQEDDVAEDVVLVSRHLTRPVGGPLRQVLPDKATADQVAQQVAEGGARGGAETDLGVNVMMFFPTGISEAVRRILATG
jgi:hypothetical protein